MSLKDSLPFVFALTIACRRGDGVESFLPRGERPSFAVAAVNQPARAKAAFSLIAPARSTRPTAANRITALKLYWFAAFQSFTPYRVPPVTRRVVSLQCGYESNIKTTHKLSPRDQGHAKNA